MNAPQPLSRKDPDAALIISLLGPWGVDRMYLGQIGLGLLKMLTLGGLGIWWLIDLFQIRDLAKQVNADRGYNP